MIIRNLNKIGFKYVLLLLAAFTVVGVTWAAFTDKGKVLGSSFSVGSSDLKLLETLGGGTGETNLKDELQGPSFSNVIPNWQQDYLIQVYNNGSTAIQLTSTANYETANDPDDLRSYIFVEPIQWNDADIDGQVDLGEEGTNLGKKSIIKWKTEGFDLGNINSGEIKGFILRFSVPSLSDTKQGKTALYDFEFDAIQL